MTEGIKRPRSAARAIADVQGGAILAAVEIAAAPEKVFRALTASDEVVRWWGSAETYRTTGWSAELRVGGRWRAEGVGADGNPFHVGGEFLAIEPPLRLVQSWEPSWEPGASTRLTYQLEPIDGGTRLTVRHQGFEGRADSCRAHGAGWELVLGWLDGYASAPPAPLQHYVLRLIAPRPTFAYDLTAEERAMMGRHAAYWRQRLREGAALLFGPVADPDGPYGLCVVRVADEAAALALASNDPAILSNTGFRFLTARMLSAVTRD